MKKVIVTGAAGLVGQNLMLKLENDYEVVAIDKHAHNLNILKQFHPKVKTIVADITKKGPWEKELDKADYLITLHAQISGLEKTPFVKNNITATKRILEIAQKKKVKYLIHLSSSVVISVAKDHYTETKREAEKTVATQKIPFTMLRPPLLFGPFDEKHLGFLARTMAKFHALPLPGKGNVIRQPLFVEDLCDVILAAMKKKPKNKIYNIIGKEKITYKQLLKLINKAQQKWVLLFPIPVWLFRLCMQAYAIIFGKPPFTKEQLKALVAEDIFPVDDWEKTFGVTYTTMARAMLKTHRGRYKDVTPHQADYYQG